MVYSPTNRVFYDWINCPESSKYRCLDVQEYHFCENCRFLTVRKVSLDNDDKIDRIFFNGLTLSCLHSNSFCQPTLIYLVNIAWFLEETSFMFDTSDFVGGMSELNNCYWLETDDFFNSTGENTEENDGSISSTVFLYTTSHLGTIAATLSRPKTFPRNSIS